MGLLSSFDSNKDHIHAGSGTGQLQIDLTSFRICGTPLGKEPWDGDFFAQALSQADTLANHPSGYELEMKDGVLNSVFLTMANFRGRFLIQNEVSPINCQTSREEILTLFGEPFWTDVDDDEVILFYEYPAESIELQFEFPDGTSLGFITLTKDGVLSVKEQRESYGVTKSWPPT